MGFSSRRKMMRNNLKSIINTEELSQLLETLGESGQSRAEQLSLSQWVALSDRLKAYILEHPQSEQNLADSIAETDETEQDLD